MKGPLLYHCIAGWVVTDEDSHIWAYSFGTDWLKPELFFHFVLDRVLIPSSESLPCHAMAQHLPWWWPRWSTQVQSSISRHRLQPTQATHNLKATECLILAREQDTTETQMWTENVSQFAFPKGFSCCIKSPSRLCLLKAYELLQSKAVLTSCNPAVKPPCLSLLGESCLQAQCWAKLVTASR